MAEWVPCILNDIATIKNGFAFKSKDFVDVGIPIIKIKNVKPNRIVLDSLSYISPEIARGKERFFIKPDDILITMSGNRADGSPDSWVGKASQFRFKGEYLLNQRVGAIEVNQNKASVSYIGYRLSSWETQLHLINNANSSGGQANISPDIIKSIELELPPLSEQKAIAEVLESLDDKIDLLHHQNKILESLAETLFRQWFFEEADENWDEKPLDETANYLNGIACQKYPPKDDINRLPVLKIKDLRSGISEASDWVASNVPSEYIIENGDVIFSWSGSLLVKIWDGNKCVLNQHLFKVTSPNFPKWFYYYWTKHHLDKFIAIAETKATTMGHIKRSDLSNSMVFVPNNQVLVEMSKKMTPLLEKLIFNNEQIRELEKLRDTLLPKLMSGEARVQYEVVA